MFVAPVRTVWNRHLWTRICWWRCIKWTWFGRAKNVSLPDPCKIRCSFYFDHDSAICNAGDTLKIETKVTAVELVSETTAILHLDASSHAEQLQFLPGQYARLQIPDTEDWRSYSLQIDQMRPINCNFSFVSYQTVWWVITYVTVVRLDKAYLLKHRLVVSIYVK